MNIEQEREGADDQTQPIDIEAATAEISSDLFGQGEDEGGLAAEAGVEQSGTETVAAPPAATEGEAPPAQEGEQTSEAVQAIGAPKTWNKEELATWATVPPDIQKQIAPILQRREEDFMRGITQYKTGAELGARYDQVVEPYRAALAAENIDPVGLFSAFAANHYLLARGTPEQKVELAANLINGYGIDFNQLATFLGGQDLTPADPEVVALRRELADLKGGFERTQNAATEAQRGAIAVEVAKFAEDPQHIYFEDVADDMTRLITAGSATSLQDAYEKAVWANPTTRQKELDRVKAEEAAAIVEAEKARTDKRQKAMGDHVKTNPTERSGTTPLGSMDDTLNETLQSIADRG